MSNDKNDTIPDNSDEAKGRAKQAAGSLIGDDEMEREGERQEAVGSAKQFVDDVGDSAKDALDKVTGNDK